MTCKVKNCDKRVLAKGYCQRHYMQIWRKGSSAQIMKEKEMSPDLLNIIHAIKEAEKIYDQASTIQARLHWRDRINKLNVEKEELENE